MEANELRIGNYIKRKRKEEPLLVNLDLLKKVQRQPFFFTGIILTAEILEKCGFTYIPEVTGYCDKSHVIYQFQNDNWGFNMFCANDRDCTITIKFLHQLQNLIYALTNEELIIKVCSL